VYIVLAKLAREDRVYGITQWVKYRQAALAEALALERYQAPSVNTYRRVLGTSFEIEESERVVSKFLPHSLTRVGASLLPWMARPCTGQDRHRRCHTFTAPNAVRCKCVRPTRVIGPKRDWRNDIDNLHQKEYADARMVLMMRLHVYIAKPNPLLQHFNRNSIFQAAYEDAGCSGRQILASWTPSGSLPHPD
jgi:hypothetical protein